MISSVSAQRISIRFQAGYNLYKMDQLQNFQKGFTAEIRNEVGIPVKIVEDFPAFYNFQAQILIHQTPRLYMGVFYDYSSTGGRIHYKDYSGEFGFDQIITQSTLGILAERNLLSAAQRNSVYTILKGFIILSNLENDEYLSVAGLNDRQKLNFEAIALGLEPALQYALNFGLYSIGLEVGYKIVLPGNFHSKNEDEAFIQYNNKDIHPQWSGLNISFSFEFRFFNNGEW